MSPYNLLPSNGITFLGLALHEARLRRSGLETPHRLGQPMATAIAINPRDLNLVLIGYEGGVVLWDLQKNAADRTFQLILPPGSPGGGTYFDDVSLKVQRSIVKLLTRRPRL